MKWSVLSDSGSVCDVTSETTTRIVVDDMDEMGRPRWLNTLCDRRMSPCDEHEVCHTCRNGLRGCVGHVGRIVLATPVVAEHFGRELLRALAVVSSSTTSRWTMVDGDVRENGVVVSGADLVRRLSVMDDDEWTAAGFRQHPVKLLCSSVVVLPPSARPHCLEHGTWRADELTSLYAKVIRCDRALRARNAVVESERRERAMDVLRAASFAYLVMPSHMPVDGLESASHSSRHFVAEAERALTTAVRAVHGAVWQRLVGKNGRLRGNLQGTRVNASARGVISCDPHLRVDEVGVPRLVANKLTRPHVIVDARTLAVFRASILKGGNDVVTVRSVRFGGMRGSPVDVMPHTRRSLAERLAVGDVVDRCLRDGDWVVMNRQPTLHQGSMQAHRARVHDGATFTLHQDACPPYNADFDGDEMNMHVPQTLEAQVDVEELMSVPRALLGQQGRPMMGVGFDGLSGMARLTDGSRLLDRAEMMAFAMRVPSSGASSFPKLPRPAISQRVSTATEGTHLWTGHQAASLLLRAVNMPDWGNDDDDDDSNGGVLIRNGGELLRGQLTKKELGRGHGGLLHALVRERGADVAVTFLSHVASFVLPWMAKQGFSVTFADLTPPTDVRASLRTRVRELARTAEEGVDRTRVRNADEVLMERLSEVRDVVGSEAGAALRAGFVGENRVASMADSGAKGGALNVTQIASALGPQAVGGTLPALVNGERSSTAFAVGDHSARARGFCFSGFLEGLSPSDYWWHACASREGVADTGVRVALVGTLYRRMAKTLENVRAFHDGSVRGRCGEIVQWMYGDGSGISPAYAWTTTVHLPSSSSSWKEEDETMTTTLRALWSTSNRVRVTLPVNLEAAERAVVESTFETDENDDDDERRRWALLRRFCEEALRVHERGGRVDAFRELSSSFSSFAKEKDDEHAWPRWLGVRGPTPLLVAVLARWGWWSERNKRRMSTTRLEACLAYVLEQYERACVQAGDAVGAIAAQATGEPATQSTLNTFHLAGTGMGTKVTTGFERQSEITGCTRNDSTPTLVLFDTHASTNDDGVLRAARGLTLGDLARTSTVRESQADAPWERVHDVVYDDDDDTKKERGTSSVFMLEFTVRREALHDTGMTLRRACRVLRVAMGESYRFTHSHDRLGPSAWIRVRGRTPTVLRTPPEAQRVLRNLANIPLCGLAGATFDGRYDTMTRSATLLCRRGCGETPLVESWRLPSTHVDHTRTEFSSVWGVAASLGIDATQRLIARELHRVFEAGGTTVPHAHVSLLAAVMTQTGTPRGVNASGAVAVNPNPLSLGSFEKPREAFVRGALNNYVSREEDVSTSVAIGQNVPVGTGDSTVQVFLTAVTRACANVHTSDCCGDLPPPPPSEKEHEEEVYAWGDPHAAAATAVVVPPPDLVEFIQRDDDDDVRANLWRPTTSSQPKTPVTVTTTTTTPHDDDDTYTHTYVPSTPPPSVLEHPVSVGEAAAAAESVDAISALFF